MSEKEYKWTPHNPNPARVEKVGDDALPVPTVCPNCGAPVRLGSHEEIYGGRSFGSWPYIYICESEECNSYVGLHAFTNLPLGTLADKATRDARKSCKPAFEKLWKTGKAPLGRNQAYAWLAEALGIAEKDCHFGHFDADQCEKAKRLCKAKYTELTGDKK